MTELSFTNHESIWVATSAQTKYPSLAEDISVDVAIVGGGIVGVLTAWFLQSQGKKVALLESRRILEGVTGYTTAKVSVAHGIYAEITKSFNDETAHLYARANLEALEWIAKEAKQRPCDFERSLVHLYVEKKDEVADLIDEQDACLKAGITCSYDPNFKAPFPLAATLSYPEQGIFHPRKFLLSFAEELEDIYENTRVTNVEEFDSGCTVTTEKGTVTAQQVVIASHFPVYDPAFFYTRLSPFRDYAIAVRLNESVPHDTFIGLKEEAYTMRRVEDRDGELLIVSGEMHRVGDGKDTIEHYKCLEDYARKYFDVKEVAYGWSTQDNTPADKIPYIGRISLGSKRVFVAAGFNGWGMTTGVVAGQLLADLITGEHNPFAKLYDPNRFNLKSVKEVSKQGLESIKGLVIDRFKSKEDEAKVKKLKPGDGTVVEIDGHEVAVYRGRDGLLHHLSAVCTHMGCILAWNKAEQSWDCPCHGSRFSCEGRVLHGPAIKDLEVM